MENFKWFRQYVDEQPEEVSHETAMFRLGLDYRDPRMLMNDMVESMLNGTPFKARTRFAWYWPENSPANIVRE